MQGSPSEPGESPAQPDDRSQFLGVLHALRMVETASADLARRLCDELQVGSNDVRAIEILIAEEGIGTTELATRLGISPPSATVLVDRLVDAGYVVRGPDPRDRRRRILRVTDRGTSAMFGALQPLLDQLQIISSKVEARDQRVIVDFLAQVASSYDTFSNRSSDGET